MRSRCIFISLNLSKHVPIAKTRSHRFWHDYNLSKHVPVAKYWFVSLLTAWMINAIVRCYVLVFLGGPQVPKKSWNWPRNGFFRNEANACVETMFTSLLAWLQFVETYSCRLPLFCGGKVFWRIENAGNAGKRSHCKNCTKRPLNSILVQMGEDYEMPGKDDSSNSSSSVYLEV